MCPLSNSDFQRWKKNSENHKQPESDWPQSAALPKRDSDPKCSQTGFRKNISRNCLPRCDRNDEKKGRWVLQLIKLLKWIFFSKQFNRLILPISPDCGRGITVVIRRELSKGRFAFRFLVKCYFDSFNAVSTKVRKFREQLCCWFVLATIYTFMINDLLITTTDTYRYLSFALFNILLFLLVHCNKQWQLR